MSDLISRVALMEFAWNHVGHTIDCNDIARFPAVDAETVRHGRWYRYPTNENYFCCSVCDGANGLWHQFAACTYKFCPWCGAKMDGGAEDA